MVVWTFMLTKSLDRAVGKRLTRRGIAKDLSIATHDYFYWETSIISAYKSYINVWVQRYLDKPTIMAWELGNEPRCTGSNGGTPTNCDPTGTTIYTWAAEISAYIKLIDSNHLVAIGDEG